MPGPRPPKLVEELEDNARRSAFTSTRSIAVEMGDSGGKDIMIAVLGRRARQFLRA